MLRSLSRGAIAAAVLFAPLAAQRVGQPATEITFTWTINFEGMKKEKLSDLRGSAVLLDFWADWCAPCVALIPKMNAMHGRLFDRGLVILGYTSTGELEKTQEFAKKHEMAYPLASGHYESGYDHKTIPHAVLIDPDGKVLFSGHPEDLDEKLIEQALAKARPANVAPGLEEVAALARDGKLGQSYTKAKALIDGGSLSADAVTQAQKRVADCEAVVNESVEAAKAAIAGGEAHKAFTLLDPVAKAYQGVPRADEAATMLAALIADKKVKREIDAGNALADCEAMAKKRDYDNAFKAYKKVVTSFSGTKAAQAANAAALAIEKGGKLGYMRGCGACEAADKTCPLHLKKKR
jgi:peroxiredoxin